MTGYTLQGPGRTWSNTHTQPAARPGFYDYRHSPAPSRTEADKAATPFVVPSFDFVKPRCFSISTVLEFTLSHAPLGALMA